MRSDIYPIDRAHVWRRRLSVGWLRLRPSKSKVRCEHCGGAICIHNGTPICTQCGRTA